MTTTGHVAPPQPGATRPGLVLVTMCVGLFLVQLDTSIVNVALPHIATGLHAGVASLQWVVDSYALVFAALLLTGGTLGDRRGHKRMVLAGLAVFGAGSIGSGLAPVAGVLIASRAVQGAGAALMMPGTLAIVTHVYPGRSEQARAIGIWAGVSGLALPLGPLLGGVLVDGLGWRSVFLINVPVIAIAIALIPGLVPEGGNANPRRLDLAGLVLGAVFLAAVTAAFIEGFGHGWSRTLPVLAAVVAGLALVTFVAAEHRQAFPMLPLGLFRRAAFNVVNVVAAAMSLATLGMIFVLTLYLQDVRHYSALAAGASLVPAFTLLAVLSPLAGRLTARIGPRVPMTVGLMLASAGMGLLTQLSPTSTYPDVLLPALMLIGVGLGLLTSPMVATAMRSVPPGQAGLASGVNNTARAAGTSMGIAVLGALAGNPSHVTGFMAGLHAAGLIGVGLFGLSAFATLLLIHRGQVHTVTVTGDRSPRRRAPTPQASPLSTLTRVGDHFLGAPAASARSGHPTRRRRGGGHDEHLSREDQVR